MKHLFLIMVAGALFSCKEKRTKVLWSEDPLGYHYQIIDFDNKNFTFQDSSILHLSATFRTQADSVFWDSNNNLGDGFFVVADTFLKDNFLQLQASRSVEGDSVVMLVPSKAFFHQQYNTAVPFFSEHDSVVKVNFRVQEILHRRQFEKLSRDLAEKEQKQIKAFIAGEVKSAALDPLGFYWLQRPPLIQGPNIEAGEEIKVKYRAQFLNGRYLDSSPRIFSFIYGTPDQLILGLNYVIGRLKMGQNAKIILPSRLAFGAYGSSNGTVPPYTPLIYDIEIIP